MEKRFNKGILVIFGLVLVAVLAVVKIVRGNEED